MAGLGCRRLFPGAAAGVRRHDARPVAAWPHAAAVVPPLFLHRPGGAGHAPVAAHRHRLTLPRNCLRSPSLALPSSRLRCELRVGLVARRTAGSTFTLSTSSCNLRSASSLLASWLRDCCAFNTTTPS